MGDAHREIDEHRKVPPMSRVNNPDNSLPYHLRGAFRGYETALGRYLKRFDLPLSQFYILRLQWSEDGSTQSDIARRAFMSESVTSQVIKKMEDQSLLRRKPNPKDSRAQFVFLTPRGEALRETIAKEGIQISMKNSPEISREDMKTAIQVLQKVREGFDRFNAK